MRYLAEQVGIEEVYAGRTPEEKVAITREATNRSPTLFIGDGINDAPALLTATVDWRSVTRVRSRPKRPEPSSWIPP